MSSEKNPDGTGDEVVNFEELDELTGDEGSSEAGTGQPIEGAGARYPKGSKTYKCPPGYAWDNEKRACVKVKKDIAGPETCDLVEVTEAELIEMAKPPACPTGQEWDPKARKCVPIKKSAEGPGSCKTGEVWDEDKKKCVPMSEMIAAKDAVINDLTGRLTNVEKALRMKRIEGLVDDQVRGGHIAPVQRDKVIEFMGGLEDSKLEDLTGIFRHQKFPLDEETGGQETKPPGEVKKGIGESTSAADLSDEDKAKLMDMHGLTGLIDEKAVKRRAS